MTISIALLLITASLVEEANGNLSQDNIIFGRSAPFNLNYRIKKQSFLPRYQIEMKDCSDQENYCLIAYPQYFQSLQFVIPKSCKEVRKNPMWILGSLKTYKIRDNLVVTKNRARFSKHSKSWFLATQNISEVVFKYSIKHGITEVFIGDRGSDLVGQVEQGADPALMPHFGGTKSKGPKLAVCDH